MHTLLRKHILPLLAALCLTSAPALAASTYYTPTTSLSALAAYGTSSSVISHASVAGYGNFDWTVGACTPNGSTKIAATGVSSSTACWIAQGINVPSVGLSGSTSGTVTLQPQAAAGTYNFNLPTTAGTAGQVLASGGGGSSPETWIDAAFTVANFAALATASPSLGYVYVLDYGLGVGGGGWFYHSATSYTPNACMVSASITGTWVRVLDGPLPITACGASPAASAAANATALQAAANATVPGTGGFTPEVYVPGNGIYQYSTGITVPTSSCWKGSGQFTSFLRYTGAGTGIQATNLNFPICFKDMTLDANQSGATIMDLAQAQSPTIESVRFRALTTNITCLDAVVTSNSYQPYFTVVNNAQFDSCNKSINLGMTAPATNQYPTRWRITNPTFNSVVDGIVFGKVSGIQVEGATVSENTNCAFNTSSDASGISIVNTTFESSSGGSEFCIDAATDLLTVVGNQAFAGAINSSGVWGTRATVLQGFPINVTGGDQALAFTGLTTSSILSKIGPVYAAGDAGSAFSGASTINGLASTTFQGVGLAQKQVGITYSASMNTDASLGNNFVITANNGTAFTINAPTNMRVGQQLYYLIRNASGGALGTITWNAVFKMAAFSSPASGFSRSIAFTWDGTNWVENYMSAADVPN